jgi:hypothetical protein
MEGQGWCRARSAPHDGLAVRLVAGVVVALGVARVDLDYAQAEAQVTGAPSASAPGRLSRERSEPSSGPACDRRSCRPSSSAGTERGGRG